MEEHNHLIGLDEQQLAIIDEFRKRRNTSVLTILFTDMKGFTTLTEQKGEVYTGRVIDLHDALLTQIIEAEGAGKVLRYIGDSIMAIFSEPSTAVERALRIQSEIDKFNQEFPQLENISVRIGLDMGQITVKNDIHPDIFGRHVNRASRVEGLADGGQIFTTFPVFDSAKGWLKSREHDHLIWKCHGKYFLKGIDAPTEIFEILDSRSRQARPPQHARKRRSLFSIYLSLGFLLLGAAAAVLLLYFKDSNEVWFVDWYPEKIKIDQKQELILEGKALPGARKALVKMDPGRHLLQFDVHFQKKYYMEIEIKPGKNYIKPEFIENYLPSLSRRLDYSNDNQALQAKEDFSYRLYDRNNRRLDQQVKIMLAIRASENKQNKDYLNILYEWQIVINGRIVSQGQSQVSNQRSNPEPQRTNKVLYEDKQHYYYLKCFMHRDSAEAEIGAVYIEYKE
ncbi:MAG: adenylate/guanylate cyclase domain-containing protein [Desulfobacteraceae bacterium]|nr:MAG: adenylate/guanylate cyclase domain-containing protein [Desulfobacteraceae bacterium]